MNGKTFFVENVIVTFVNECISENGIIFALIKAGKLVNFKQTNMRLFFTKRELRLRKKRIVMMIACMAVLLAIYIILTWPKKVVPEAPVVIVEPAHTENVEIYGDYVGRIRAQQFVEVRARVEGFLESMEFAEGTYVTKNQVLFVIDPRQYRAKADKARAQLKKDSATTRKAERDLERIRPLYEQNAASQLDLDNAIAAYETAVASVGMSQADLDQAEQELGYTLVRSPISGHISERYVDLGTLVGTAGKSLLATVVKSDTVLVDFSMTALDYLKSKERNVTLGQKDSTRSWQPTVTITLPDNSVYPYKGLVDFAEPQVDPKTGTFSVRAEMPNPDRVLLPGQFTKVRLLLDVRENATVIPQKALIIEKGGAYAFVMRRDSTVERRFIELGPEFGNNVVIERGLVSGEMVVSEGYHKLTPGIKVRVAEATRKEESATKEK
jgi:membrane fusion protein (multidrug efflux system)